MLLATGLILLILGIDHLGGFDVGSTCVSTGSVSVYNEDPRFLPSVCWQDAMANSAMFYFLNQAW